MVDVLKTKNLSTYKLSQDYIETFFSALRSKGFNNNPNAQQFESAYKRLLVRHEIYFQTRKLFNNMYKYCSFQQKIIRRNRYLLKMMIKHALSVETFEHVLKM